MPRKVRRVLDGLETALIVGPAVAALALVGEQVVARHFYHAAMVDWSDEIVVYLLMWSVFVSLGRVSADGMHIRTELLTGHLSTRARRLIESALTLLAIVFLSYLGWLAFQVAHEAFVYDDRTASSLRFPIWIYYAIMPIACAGMVIGFVIRLLRLRRGGKAAP